MDGGSIYDGYTTFKIFQLKQQAVLLSATLHSFLELKSKEKKPSAGQVAIAIDYIILSSTST
jgi:hypothetical protein